MNFDLDTFISDCADVIAEAAPTKAVREFVARAVSEPKALQQALGVPTRGQIQRLHVSDELGARTIFSGAAAATIPMDS